MELTGAYLISMAFQVFFVTGLVNVTKNIKDIGKWAYLVAIAYGIIFSFLFGAAFIGFSFQNVVIFIVQGILVGGAATGVYDIAKFMKH